jgi:hypothetical protein
VTPKSLSVQAAKRNMEAEVAKLKGQVPLFEAEIQRRRDHHHEERGGIWIFSWKVSVSPLSCRRRFRRDTGSDRSHCTSRSHSRFATCTSTTASALPVRTCSASSRPSATLR